MAAVTSTSFALVGEEGVFLDSVQLQKAGRTHRIRLGALVEAPASGWIDVQLAYQHDQDSRLTELPGTRIFNTDNRYKKLIGNWLDVSGYVGQNQAFVVRVQARVSSGTGNVILPTVEMESG